MATPKIILYTNHGCPWAHRAHIALAELALPFTEEIIDLSVPRTAEYLAINPRGLVPSISYNGEIITESAIVAQFLADAHPSHLVKTSSEPGGALQRARISFFVDAFISKLNPQFWAGLRADNEEERNKAGQTLVDAVKKELEPLLADAAPFFGGASKLTLAEVQLGSFLLRIFSFPSHGLLASNLLSLFEAQVPNFYKWGNATIAEKSVNHIYDAQAVADRTAARIAKTKAEAEATKAKV